MTELQLHFSNRQQADHPLSPGVHRVVRQPNGVLAIGEALAGVLMAQFCLDQRGLWLQVPNGARGIHVNGRPVRDRTLAHAVRQGASLAHETRRARDMAEAMVGPTALAAHQTGQVLTSLRGLRSVAKASTMSAG